MRIIINNSNNIMEEDLDLVTNKVRGVIINEYNITLIEYGNILMFPGGKVESGENEIGALKRELSEELGIEIEDDEVIPYLEYNNYLYNYPSREGEVINKLVNTKYFVIDTDKKVDLSNISLSDKEKFSDFNIKNINIFDIDTVLLKYKSNNPRWIFFRKELYDVLDIVKWDFMKKYLTERFNQGIKESNPGYGKGMLERTVYLDKDNVIKRVKKRGLYNE